MRVDADDVGAGLGAKQSVPATVSSVVAGSLSRARTSSSKWTLPANARVTSAGGWSGSGVVTDGEALGADAVGRATTGRSGLARGSLSAPHAANRTPVPTTAASGMRESALARAAAYG